jgi:hypothetical protein
MAAGSWLVGGTAAGRARGGQRPCPVSRSSYLGRPKESVSSVFPRSTASSTVGTLPSASCAARLVTRRGGARPSWVTWGVVLFLHPRRRLRLHPLVAQPLPPPRPALPLFVWRRPLLGRSLLLGRRQAGPGRWGAWRRQREMRTCGRLWCVRPRHAPRPSRMRREDWRGWGWWRWPSVGARIWSWRTWDGSWFATSVSRRAPSRSP